MMCKHDFESQTIICPDCEGEGQRHLHAMGPEQCITCHGRGNISGKPIHKLITNLETALIDNLYNQLAAANANNKALREENELLRHKAAGHDATMLQTELAAAPADIAALLAEVERLNGLLDQRCADCHLKVEKEVTK